MLNALVARLLKMLWPLPAGYVEAGPTLDELARTYGKWIWGTLAIMLVGIVPFAACWWWLLDRLDLWNTSRFGPAVYHLHEMRIALILPAFLLGILSAGLVQIWTYRRLLGPRFAEYQRFELLTAGFDSRRAGRLVICVAFVLSVLMVVLALSWHVMFLQDRIEFYSWGGMGNTAKPYSSIREIRTAPQLRAPSGTLVDRREYEVEFEDGSTWSTNFAPATLTLPEKQQLANFIAEQAKLRIRELDVLE
jgi:hypothetical protein